MQKSDQQKFANVGESSRPNTHKLTVYLARSWRNCHRGYGAAPCIIAASNRYDRNIPSHNPSK